MHFSTLHLSFVLLVSGSASAHNPLAGRSSRKGLLVFGDSYLLNSGTEGEDRHMFIGSSSEDPHYSASLLSRSEIKMDVSNTWSGGPLLSNWITGCGTRLESSVSPKDCPVQLWPFASAGAAISSKWELPGGEKMVTFARGISSARQVELFLESGNGFMRENLDQRQTLVALWPGFYELKFTPKELMGVPAQREEMITKRIEAFIAEVVKPLHKAGWKNFLVMKLGPTDRLPQLPGMGDGAPRKSDDWNRILEEKLGALDLNDMELLLFDTHSHATDIIDNYRAEGFENNKDWCKGWGTIGIPKEEVLSALANPAEHLTSPSEQKCLGSPNSYIYWDFLHYTSHMHLALAKRVDKEIAAKFPEMWGGVKLTDKATLN